MFSIEEVRDHWDSVAAIYDNSNSHNFNPHNWRFMEGIRHLDVTYSKVKVLNLWARTGDAIPYIRSKLPNAIIHNFELSKNMIKIAKERYPDEIFKVTNLKTINLESNSMDYIVSPETLEHTPHPLNLIKEFYRVLKPEGKLILSLPPRVADFHQKFYEYIFGGHGEGARRGIPSKEVKRMLKEAKFFFISHKAILLFPIGSVWFIELGNKILEYLPFLRELGIMQFYIAKKGDFR